MIRTKRTIRISRLVWPLQIIERGDAPIVRLGLADRIRAAQKKRLAPHHRLVLIYQLLRAYQIKRATGGSPLRPQRMLPNNRSARIIQLLRAYQIKRWRWGSLPGERFFAPTSQYGRFDTIYLSGPKHTKKRRAYPKIGK